MNQKTELEMLGELVEQVKKRGGKNKLWKHEMSFQFLAPGKPCWTWLKIF